MIVAQGRLQTREWIDRDGKKRVAVEVMADSVHFGGDRKKTSGAEQENYRYPAGDSFPRVDTSGGGYGESFVEADDVPF